MLATNHNTAQTMVRTSPLAIHGRATKMNISTIQIAPAVAIPLATLRLKRRPRQRVGAVLVGSAGLFSESDCSSLGRRAGMCDDKAIHRYRRQEVFRSTARSQ